MFFALSAFYFFDAHFPGLLENITATGYSNYLFSPASTGYMDALWRA